LAIGIWIESILREYARASFAFFAFIKYWREALSLQEMKKNNMHG